MKKTNYLFLLLIGLSIYGAISASVESSPYEETYPEIGYKTVEEALNDFEKHFKQGLKLPLKVTSVAFI